MDSVGALIPIATAAQADPILRPNTLSSFRLFFNTTTGEVCKIDEAGNITPIGVGAGTGVLTAYVNVPSADVLNLGTTPVIVVPKVIGKTIIPLQCFALLNFATTPYATHGNLFLAIDTASKSLYFMPEASFLFANAFTSAIFPIDPPAAGYEQFAGDNDLVLGCELGNPTAGDSDLTIVVNYILI